MYYDVGSTSDYKVLINNEFPGNHKKGTDIALASANRDHSKELHTELITVC